MAAPIPTAITPTAMDVTAPVITRESRSRPYWSVPKRCAPDGPCRRPVIDIASGSCGVYTRLMAAGAIRSAVIAPPSVNVRCRNGRRRIYAIRLSTTSSREPHEARVVVGLFITDARIEDDVEQIDGEVDQHDRRGDEQR